MCSKIQGLSYVMTILFSTMLLMYIGCGRGDSSKEKSQPPAKVENPVKEETLTTISLSPEAESRLGIETKPLEQRSIPKTIKVGGEIIALPGQELKVVAPVAGTVMGSQGGRILGAGSFVKKGQEVMRLLLMPPERDLISAQEEVGVKQVEFEVVLAKAKRAKQLLADRAISEKSYEETQAELARAKAALSAAKGKFDLLSGTDLDSVSGNLSTLTLESPLNGVIQGIFVAPGQTVPASTVLFEVASYDPVWVRVPVYTGYLSKVDREKEAVIIPMGTELESKTFTARPIQGPPLSDVQSASADLYYEIENKNGLLRIGQKVSVVLIQKTFGESLVVPWSTVLYDMYGGNWVYVRTAPHVYSRRRVEVSHISDGMAVLTRGVLPNDEVVVSGAAEIFGTEFGGGK